MYPLWHVVLLGIGCATVGVLLGVVLMCLLGCNQPAPCSMDGCPHRRP